MSTFKCFNCEKTFTESQVKKKKMPSNFTVLPMKKEAIVPQCPHCDAVAFFGFRMVSERSK